MDLFEKQVIYGCMHIGGSWNDNPLTSGERKKAFTALEAAIENGYRFFDHADIYCLGKSETVFGEFLKENPSIRKDILIQTKAGIELSKALGGSNRYNFSTDYLRQQVERSMERLGVDVLDVFLLHRPDPLWDPEKVVAFFHKLNSKGLVRFFGVSNMNAAQISLLQSHLNMPLVTNQVQLSLGHSGILNEGVDLNSDKFLPAGMTGILEYTRQQEMTIQAWSPLDRGRYAIQDQIKNPEDTKVENLLNKLAEKYNCPIETIQIAWLLKIPGPIQPVIGSTNPERIKACAQANTFPLTREEWYDLWIAGRGRLK